MSEFRTKPTQEFFDAKAAFDRARAYSKSNPSPESRAAAVAAARAMEAVAPERKAVGGYGSMAGRRQTAQRKAEHEERIREAGMRRKWATAKQGS